MPVVKAVHVGVAQPRNPFIASSMQTFANRLLETPTRNKKEENPKMQSTKPMTNAIKENDLKALQTNFQGELVSPSDENYDQVRAVYNGMIDRYPALIARCTNAADVQAAVNFARER